MSDVSPEEARQISAQAGQVFQPRTPINRRDLFAGRWDQLTSIMDAVSQVGLHVVIYGERGVGKTSIANMIAPLLRAYDEGAGGDGSRLIVKVNAHADDAFSDLWSRAFDEVALRQESESFGFKPERESRVESLRQSLPREIAPNDVRRMLMNLAGSVFIFDEFDRLGPGATTPFTDLIKTLSDYAIDATVIIVGVAETVEELIRDHASIERAIIQVPMPRMTLAELRDILRNAEEFLSVEFEAGASDRIVRMCQGLPHYTHLVGLHAVRHACSRLSPLIAMQDANGGFVTAVQHAHQSIRTAYSSATHSSHPDALYRQVLLACAIAAYAADEDRQGFFQAASVTQPLSMILGKDVQVSTFNKHLAEFCDDANRGGILERRGQPRLYRYRFTNPLMPPYVIMSGISTGLVTDEQLARFA